ncbi:electron transfer flavoprotein subunit beta/FixA family protein [soil metagenome]
MKIVVLVKEVPDTYGERRLDTVTGLLDRAASDPVIDEIDERALEVALQYKDADKNTEVVVMTLGPDTAKDGLRKLLAMGADRAVHIVDDGFVGSDALRTAQALAAALERAEFDLVLTGNESTDGRCGVVPAMVAELLGLPIVGNLSAVDIHDGSITGTRSTATATTTLRSPLPAVASVTEKSAEARFPSFKGTMTAKRKPLAIVGQADIGLAAPTATSAVLTVVERPARAAGEKIYDRGDAGAAIVAFLRERKVV